ncbi:MAG: hypothetical protein Unbinned6224contig1001_31 [Prokaryotic dsDNA virus sp.]|nr:MAG: hypothetical protein Unbinned6224contig1001_31 [Prokaryotic dsDNA virus sp.]|tara:strand:- start:920 stop:1282 length:363 start_codon:yes stop_codon:yes gene_type:complete
MATNLKIRELHSSSATESVDLDYQTGYVPLTNLNRNVIIRRISLDYQASTSVSVKLYTNGDNSSLKATLTYPANNVNKIYNLSLKPNVRAKTLAVRVMATGVTSQTESVIINKIEIETDG